MNIQNLLSDFKEYLEHERKLEPASIRAYLSDVECLNRHVDGKELLSIKRDDLREYMRQMSRDGLAVMTIRRKMHCYRTFWAWLKLCEIDNRMLPEGIPLPKRKRPQPRWLTDSQLKTFVYTLDGDPGLDLAWMMLALLGLRRSELVNMKWDDIDLEGQKITIPPGKGGHARVLHYPHALQFRLDAMPGREGLVFQFGKSYFQKYFKRHLEACNLENEGFTLHTLRHTFASHLISRGVDITVVKELLGHKDITHTMIYVHHNPVIYQEAIQKHILSEETESHE